MHQTRHFSFVYSITSHSIYWFTSTPQILQPCIYLFIQFSIVHSLNQSFSTRMPLGVYHSLIWSDIPWMYFCTFIHSNLYLFVVLSQVDRSAAYAARWIAKSLVAAKLCRRVLVQISYAIGIAQPLSVTVFSYGTSTKSEDELLQIVRDNFDLRPGRIVKYVQQCCFLNRCLYGVVSLMSVAILDIVGQITIRIFSGQNN